MRAFVQLRRVIASHDKLAIKLSELERRLEDHDEQILAIFEAIRQLMSLPETSRKKIYLVKSLAQMPIRTSHMGSVTIY